MDTHKYVQAMIDEMNDSDLRTAAIAMLEGREILDAAFLISYLSNVGLCAEHEGAEEIIRVAKAHPEIIAQLEECLDLSTSRDINLLEDEETDIIVRFTDLIDTMGLEPFLSHEKLGELTEMANRNIRLAKKNSARLEFLWDKAAAFRDMLLGDRFGLPRYFVGEMTSAVCWVTRDLDRPSTGDQKIRQLCWNRVV